jgi:hypothetical protein
MLQVVNRCFQILQSRCDDTWRTETDLVITPDVRGVEWHAFERAPQLVRAGEESAWAALPQIQEWFWHRQTTTVFTGCIGWSRAAV